MQPLVTVGNMAITIGWLIALVILILAIIFLFIGVPDERTLLFFIGGLALARLL